MRNYKLIYKMSSSDDKTVILKSEELNRMFKFAMGTLDDHPGYPSEQYSNHIMHEVYKTLRVGDKIDFYCDPDVKLKVEVEDLVSEGDSFLLKGVDESGNTREVNIRMEGITPDDGIFDDPKYMSSIAVDIINKSTAVRRASLEASTDMNIRIKNILKGVRKSLWSRELELASTHKSRDLHKTNRKILHTIQDLVLCGEKIPNHLTYELEYPCYDEKWELVLSELRESIEKWNDCFPSQKN